VFVGVHVGVRVAVRVQVEVKLRVAVGGVVAVRVGEAVGVEVLIGVEVGVRLGVLVGVRVKVRVAVGVPVLVGVAVGAGVPVCGYMKLTPAMSSLFKAAQRASKCAVAYMVAFGSAECPRPMVCPSSCVTTSARLHSVQTEHPPQPLLKVTLPVTICTNVVPLTTVVLLVEQYPPSASTPLQPLGSLTSLFGSLNTMRLMLHWLNGPGAVVPPSWSTRLEVGTSLQAARAASNAAREVENPKVASPVESMR